MVADSTQVVQYLNTVSTITGSKLRAIVVETKSGQSTTFNAYALPASAPEESEEMKGPEYVVSSDALVNSFFEGSSVFSRLFVGKGKFASKKK